MSNAILKNYLRITFVLFFLYICFSLSAVIVNCQENQPAQEVPIYVAKFSEPGCHDCEKAARLLEQIVFQYPQIEIMEFDISTSEGVALAEQLGEFYQVPEYDRLLVPLLYIGDEYFLREQINYENIIDYIEKIKGEE